MFDNFIEENDNNFLSEFEFNEYENNSIFNDTFLTPDTNTLDFVSETEQASNKNKKIQKKDNFNYKKYVEDEIKKLNVSNMDPQVKKKLTQKIRNRMSAQRSRQRQKNNLFFLEEENKILKKRLIEQEKTIFYLQQRNQELQEKSKNTNTSTTTEQNQIQDEQQQENSLILQRVESQSQNSFSLNRSFLLLMIIFLITFMDTDQINNKITNHRIFPMIAPVKSRQLMIPQTKEILPYPQRVNFRDVVPLVCYRDDIKQKNKYNLLMDSQDMENFEFGQNYFVSDIQKVEMNNQDNSFKFLLFNICFKFYQRIN